MVFRPVARHGARVFQGGHVIERDAHRHAALDSGFQVEFVRRVEIQVLGEAAKVIGEQQGGAAFQHERRVADPFQDRPHQPLVGLVPGGQIAFLLCHRSTLSFCSAVRWPSAFANRSKTCCLSPSRGIQSSRVTKSG